MVGHEFSHILNGDIRLNVRLAAWLHGFLVIVVYAWSRLNPRSLRLRRTEQEVQRFFLLWLVVLPLAMVLFVVGSIGYFFGRLIQAAISREREQLADAAAVQFTRFQGGLVGALTKIGGYAIGSSLQSVKATAIGHFFFAQGFHFSFAGLWATHPPLATRIRAIDPHWDGKFFAPKLVVDIAHETFRDLGSGSGPRLTADDTAREVFRAAPKVPGPVEDEPPAFRPAAAVADLGTLAGLYYEHGRALLAALPPGLRDAAHDRVRAPAVVAGLLLSGSRADRDRQQQLVAEHLGAETATALARLRPSLGLLSPFARLPLLQLCLPALRQLEPAASERLLMAVDMLVHADGIVTTFEFTLLRIFTRQLRRTRPGASRAVYASLDCVATEVSVLLSTLARESGRTEGAAAEAFAAASATMAGVNDPLHFVAAAESSLSQLDRALEKIALASPLVRRAALIAAAHAIGADGRITAGEGELFRAISAALDCPMPLAAGARPEAITMAAADAVSGTNIGELMAGK